MMMLSILPPRVITLDEKDKDDINEIIREINMLRKADSQCTYWRYRKCESKKVNTLHQLISVVSR